MTQDREILKVQLSYLNDRIKEYEDALVAYINQEPISAIRRI